MTDPQRSSAREQDIYNAEQLIRVHGARIRYVPEWSSWCYYTGTHWERDAGGVRIQQYAVETVKELYTAALAIYDFERRQAEDGLAPKHAQQAVARAAASQNEPKIRAMVQLARGYSEVIYPMAGWDRNTWLLACKNGCLELKTGHLRANSPHDNLTKSIGIQFIAGASAPRWERFLARVLPDDEVRAFIQRFFGYCLTGDVGERIFTILYGTGQNGKSVVLEVMQRLLGSYAVVAPPTLLMAQKHEGHPTEIATLHGARLAVSSEVREGRAFDEERVKRFTGNDRLTARRMQEDFWSFDPTHKFVIAANHRPRVTDTSASFWDRIILVPFDVRIPDSEKIPNLQNILVREEASGILAWAYAGLRDYLEHGLRIPRVLRDATLGYRASEDSILQFLADRCEFGLDYRETTEAVTHALKHWCGGLNLFVPGPRKLAEKLKEAGCAEHRIGTSRGWRGVRIKQITRLPDVTEVTEKGPS